MDYRAFVVFVIMAFSVIALGCTSAKVPELITPTPTSIPAPTNISTPASTPVPQINVIYSNVTRNPDLAANSKHVNIEHNINFNSTAPKLVKIVFDNDRVRLGFADGSSKDVTYSENLDAFVDNECTVTLDPGLPDVIHFMFDKKKLHMDFADNTSKDIIFTYNERTVYAYGLYNQ